MTENLNNPKKLVLAHLSESLLLFSKINLFSCGLLITYFYYENPKLRDN